MPDIDAGHRHLAGTAELDGTKGPVGTLQVIPDAGPGAIDRYIGTTVAVEVGCEGLIFNDAELNSRESCLRTQELPGPRGRPVDRDISFSVTVKISHQRAIAGEAESGVSDTRVRASIGIPDTI